jgi:high-affinity Fe2+/Pb2+ permease
MTWSPSDMQHREPHFAVKTLRKFSALIRWVILVVVAGLAIAALIGIGVSALFTAIQNGL